MILLYYKEKIAAVFTKSGVENVLDLNINFKESIYIDKVDFSLFL